MQTLRVNDIMAVSRVLASEVVNTLFDDKFGLSEDNSDESDEDCIYGYLGAAVLHQTESRVYLPSEDETDMEQSLLERTNDGHNSQEPSSTSDSDFQATSSSGEDDGDVDLPATPSEPSSEVTTDHMVSSYT